MKRLWLGVGLLLILLAIGIASAVFMSRFHDALSQDLEAASQAVLRGDWVAARSLAEKAEMCWQRGKRIAAAFADHEPLEQVDDGFAQLTLFSQMELTADYAAACVHLSELAQALGESHGLVWWNFL